MTSVIDRYRSLVTAGELKPDAEQEAAAHRLNQLQQELETQTAKKGLIGRLFRNAEASPPRGLYIWGSVGRGKSMLMDLFFHAWHFRQSDAPIFMSSCSKSMRGFG